MSGQKKFSESEEMYLVTIRKLCEHCTEHPVPIPEIARELGVQPVSVNQMINKLVEQGLVKYFPYKGVELTSDGMAISTRILRHRRLWEVFMVKTLQMDLVEADRIACQLEHYTTMDLADRLSDFLENPEVCFHGDPIYSIREGDPQKIVGIPLSALQIGQLSYVLRIDADEIATKFLADAGIRLGVAVRLLALGNSGDLLLESPQGPVQISGKMSSSLIVSDLPVPEEIQEISKI
jgi:DtxR family transcriptional regulator, Mn-dependent transcriptional regulator